MDIHVCCYLAFQTLMWFYLGVPSTNKFNLVRCENLPQFVKSLQQVIDDKSYCGLSCIVSYGVLCYCF